MKIYNRPDSSTLKTILQRPLQEAAIIEASVNKILEKVKTQGDEALRFFTNQFDSIDLIKLEVTTEEFQSAAKLVPLQLKEALQTAFNNIELFHNHQLTKNEVFETMPGVTCWQKSVGIEKVGLYIPGGSAPLFSTVLMLAIPAKIAGCKEIILCTPPQKDGRVNPVILYTASLCGVQRIFKVGGAQAIGAMAFGTETIPVVYKIFGPGNQYVTTAKQLVSQLGVAIDMPAGPSEVMVVADRNVPPAFVAADLLSQAEHGEDSQVVLVTFNETIVTSVLLAIEKQLEQIPRKDIAKTALKNSAAIVVDSKKEALDIINQYAPEHLILATEDAELLAGKIINAGSVFIGNYTPESVGDYASGTNHTLPTNGYAKAYSGLNLDAFVKKITFQKLTPTGLINLGPTVEIMAEAEQLVAHKQAISLRLDYLNKTR